MSTFYLRLIENNSNIISYTNMLSFQSIIKINTPVEVFINVLSNFTYYLGTNSPLKNYLKSSYILYNSFIFHLNKIKIQDIYLYSDIILFVLISVSIIIDMRIYRFLEFQTIFNIELCNNNFTEIDNLIYNKNFLILLLSKINSKVQSPIKGFFKVFFSGLLIIKLLGLNIFTDVILNKNNLIIIVYVLSIYNIFFEILSLYIVYSFSNKSLKISSILPDFLINRFKEIETLSNSQPGIEEFKDNSYIHIYLYTGIIILVTLINNYI